MVIDSGLAQGDDKFESLIVAFQTLLGRQCQEVVGDAQIDAEVHRRLASLRV